MSALVGSWLYVDMVVCSLFVQVLNGQTFSFYQLKIYSVVHFVMRHNWSFLRGKLITPNV